MLREELQIKFNDTLRGRTFTLKILDPKQDMASADIEMQANQIIASKVFGEGLILESAQIVRTTVEEIQM